MDAPASISSPEVLLGAIARGSHAALKRLYEQESRRLYGIALRIVRRPEIAADVLQETFVQVWQNARTFVPEKGSAVGWLTGITRFRALDAVRKSGRAYVPTNVPRVSIKSVCTSPGSTYRAGMNLGRCDAG